MKKLTTNNGTRSTVIGKSVSVESQLFCKQQRKHKIETLEERANRLSKKRKYAKRSRANESTKSIEKRLLRQKKTK